MPHYLSIENEEISSELTRRRLRIILDKKELQRLERLLAHQERWKAFFIEEIEKCQREGNEESERFFNDFLRKERSKIRSTRNEINEIQHVIQQREIRLQEYECNQDNNENE